MYWYGIKRISGGYAVFKTVKLNNSIGSIKKITGSKQDCIKYCEDHGIKVNVRRRIKNVQR